MSFGEVGSVHKWTEECEIFALLNCFKVLDDLTHFDKKDLSSSPAQTEFRRSKEKNHFRKNKFFAEFIAAFT